MAKKQPAEVSVTAAHAAAFRLSRHHLAERTPNAERRPSIVDVVRDTGGIQAQVQSAAELAIWTRRRETTRDDIRRALWDTREIVKTSAMRLTLHLIPARDLAIYIAAVKPMATGTLQRWHARIGAKAHHVQAMVETVVESLDDGPRTQQELIARAKKKAGKGVRAWLDHAWSAVRPARPRRRSPRPTGPRTVRVAGTSDSSRRGPGGALATWRWVDRSTPVSHDTGGRSH